MGNSNVAKLWRSGSEIDNRSPRRVPYRSTSDPEFNKTTATTAWPKNYSRKSPRSSMHVSRTSWPVPTTEAIFLPEYKIKADFVDDFRTVYPIAKGAFGHVLKVTHGQNGLAYAMKVLSKSDVIQRMAIHQCKEEVRVHSLVGRHPFVLSIHYAWQSRRSLFIVTEFVARGDLYTLWRLHGKFDQATTRLYSAELATALDFLHGAGVVYRDLKLENVLVDHRGHLRVADFGLSKELKRGGRTHTICGTVQYMAPEILEEKWYNHAVDWWSLGVVTFALLAGHYPVPAAHTHTEMAERVSAHVYNLPTWVGLDATNLVKGLLCKDPMRRVHSLFSFKKHAYFAGLSFDDLVNMRISLKTHFHHPNHPTSPLNGGGYPEGQNGGEENQAFSQFDWSRADEAGDDT